MRLFIGIKTKCGYIAALIASAVLVIAAAPVFPITAAPRGTDVNEFTAYLNERVPAIMDAYEIPGASVALIEDGDPVWSGAYGYADIEADRKLTTGDRMRVQSVSKSVTAWGVMKLAEQGWIDLDMPAAQYINSWTFPESPYATEITVRQLLSHTAGLDTGLLTRYDPDDDMQTLRDSLSADVAFVQQPGMSFKYSNTGYNLLELLIEDVTGRDFAEYMQNEVLLPLGMTDAAFAWQDTFDPPVPKSYNLSGTAIPVYVYPEKASGGLFATVDDIAVFTAAGMTGSGQTVLSDQSVCALYTPEADDLSLYSLVYDAYGFGYYIEELSNGQFAVAHGGQGTGWTSYFQCVPDTGDGIVILTNSERSWPMISYILCDWADWCGLIRPHMGRIVSGIYAIWASIGLIWFFVIWQAMRIAGELMRGRRHVVPLSLHRRGLRTAALASAAVIVAVLLWCAARGDILIISIVPITAVWLGITGAAAAVVLVLSVLLPEKVPNIPAG